jgi:hypothetical protein
MGTDKISFEISEEGLDSLIYGLKQVHSKIRKESDLQVTIDFNTGTIGVFVTPSGDYKFDVEF